MSILTREHLLDGSYLARLALPVGSSWSEEDVNRSLAQALEGRPSDMIWVFAYGSLMWNPMLELAEESLAVLDGWHRSFSVRSISGRGTLEHPGRVPLEAGGQVQGVALRIRPEVVDAEMRLLWLREMAGGRTCRPGFPLCSLVAIVSRPWPSWVTLHTHSMKRMHVWKRLPDWLQRQQAASARMPTMYSHSTKR